MIEREIYGQTVLNNGLRIVWERMPELRSVALGVWIGTGSRNESSAADGSGTSVYSRHPAPNGISHFTEHMLFKGTDTMTARDIAERIENVGGQINAFTGKELTCFYTKTMSGDLPLAAEILSDMVMHSRFSPEDVELERGVVSEEISMDEDSPEDLVHDVLSGGVYSGSSLGLPILGTQESILGIDSEAFHRYTGHFYTPDNACVSVVGRFDEDRLVPELEKHFGSWRRGTGLHTDYGPENFNPGLYVRTKDVEQLHICVACPAPAPEDEKASAALAAISTYLGGGMSSVLFQELREKRGLVYNTYSYAMTYKRCGGFAVYGAMNPDKAGEFMNIVRQETGALAAGGMTDRQLANVKEQLKGTLILSGETSGSRMSNLGKNLLLYDEIKSIDQTVELIDSLTTRDVQDVLDKYFAHPQAAVSAVGNITREQLGAVLG